MNGKALEEGEKYLRIDIGGFKIGLFPNKNKKSDREPDFVGVIRVGCWVNKKKADPGKVGVL